MSVRHDHLLSELRRKVQTVIARGFNDPRIRGLISVTGVDLTPDLAEAKVLVSVLPAEYAKLTLQGLRSASGKIQHELAPSLRLRRIPRFRFELDDSLKRQAAIDAALNRSASDSSNDAHASNDEGQSP